MQLIESGESRGKQRPGGKKNEKKRDTSPEPQGFLKCGKCALFCLFILLQRAQFPGSIGVKHTQFGTDLSPLISLA